VKKLFDFKDKSYYLANEPQIIAEIGQGTSLLVINVATHGNEYLPVMAVHEVLENLKGEKLSGHVRFTLANPPALRVQKRFLFSDLNRIYPGNIHGYGEELLAARMLSFITNANYVLDLHTAPKSPAFGVLTQYDEIRLQLLEKSGVPRIVKLALSNTPHSLVDFTQCGAGIELGPHQHPDSLKMGVQVISNLLVGLGFLAGEIESVQCEYYEMFGTISRQRADSLGFKTAMDFVPLSNRLLGIAEKGMSYPVLSDPLYTYKDEFCYIARKVGRDQLIKVK
jgi:predicted deacylase